MSMRGIRRMVVSALFVGACTCCAAYKPAVAPLMAVRGERMTPESAWREYPRPQLVRDGWINLNGLWEYAVTPKNGEQPVEWQGRILVPFSVESALSGVGRPIEPGELLWYRRTFEAQPRKGERLLLHFGAVDFRTQVWVNGVEVTDVPNESGNLPFSLDITEAVKKTVRVTRKELVPTSMKTPQVWKYTFDAPAEGWEREAFDDGAWKSGEAGFGNARIKTDHPQAAVRTAWEAPAIWLRRVFEFSGDVPSLACLNIFYDEDARVYLNGTLIKAFTGYNTQYAVEDIDMAAFAKALKQGRNVLAVKAVNTVGGAYIDLGLDSETEH